MAKTLGESIGIESTDIGEHNLLITNEAPGSQCNEDVVSSQPTYRRLRHRKGEASGASLLKSTEEIGITAMENICISPISKVIEAFLGDGSAT